MKYVWIIAVWLLGCSPQREGFELTRSDIAIRDAYFDGRAAITPTSAGFRISLMDTHGALLDRAIFGFPPYQLDTADVDRDGRTDLLVGVIKAAVFDPGEKKRLFILRIDDGQLRPLWLGSKVCQELVDFKSLPNGLVRTLERTRDGTFAVGVYEWQSFGLALNEYTYHNQSYHDALTSFHR